MQAEIKDLPLWRLKIEVIQAFLAGASLEALAAKYDKHIAEVEAWLRTTLQHGR